VAISVTVRFHRKGLIVLGGDAHAPVRTSFFQDLTGVVAHDDGDAAARRIWQVRGLIRKVGMPANLYRMALLGDDDWSRLSICRQRVDCRREDDAKQRGRPVHRHPREVRQVHAAKPLRMLNARALCGEQTSQVYRSGM
jgi:hypothetical protein